MLLARLPLAFAFSLAALPALAHHPMGGTTPTTFMQGLLSGIGHPILGLDHLAALIAVGLVASRFASGGLLLPVLWIVGMAPAPSPIWAPSTCRAASSWSRAA